MLFRILIKIKCFLLCINFVVGVFNPSLHDIFEAVDAWMDDPSSANTSYGNIKYWNVSGITTMEELFSADRKPKSANFNDDITGWDMSSVTSTSRMFDGAESFDQPIGVWNISNVESFEAMFIRAGSFNQDLSNWNTGKVTTFFKMFRDASSFDGSIDAWDTSSVEDMGHMFVGASEFNSPINSWDTSSVTSMEHMFLRARNFNQPLSNWDVSSVESMLGMFLATPAFDQDLSAWCDKISDDCFECTKEVHHVGTKCNYVESGHISEDLNFAGIVIVAAVFGLALVLAAWVMSGVQAPWTFKIAASK